MSRVDRKPKARGGLLTSDHSKRGRRYVTIIDPGTHQVTLLDPWEHAVLVLCDGTRDEAAIAKLLESGIEGEAVDLKAVGRALELFERERLVEPTATAERSAIRRGEPPVESTATAERSAIRRGEPPVEPTATAERSAIRRGEPPVSASSSPVPTSPGSPAAVMASAPSASAFPRSLGGATGSGKEPLSRPGPRTLARLQDAYREWHKDPVITREILSGMAPFARQEGYFRAGLEPTVALPDLEDEDRRAGRVGVGEMIVLADAESVLEGRRGAPGSGDGGRDETPTLVGALAGDEEQNRPRDVLGPRRARRTESPVKSAPERASPSSAGASPSSADLGEVADVVRDVAELLEAADLDFREVESREAAERAAIREKKKKKREPPPPVGRATGGEARPPEPKQLTKPKVKVLVGVEPDPVLLKKVESLPAHRAVPVSEAALLPTMVSAPPPDNDPGSPPTPLVPARTRSPAPEKGAKSADEIVLSELQIEGPTEGSLSARSPSGPVRAREIFERLRRAGLRSRISVELDGDRTDEVERPHRRRDDDVSRRFDQALESLTAGEVDVALAHFRRLHEKMPESRRLALFIEAIDSVRTDARGAVSSERLEQHGAMQRIVDEFRGALEEAVAYGRCPSCFSVVPANFSECFACGFALDGSRPR